MDQQLRNAIQQQLNQLGATAPQLNQMVTEKLYEIYTLSCLVSALESLNAQMEARDVNDNPTASLEFRLAPGVIGTPTSTPGFVMVQYGTREYEIQNGLRVLGRSRVLHELDVCLLDRSEALRCRANQIHPVQAKVRLLMECKYYGNSLSLSLGREYLGLSSEYNCRVKTLVSNVSSSSIHDLFKSHAQKENFETSPAYPDNVDRFVKWLANELRQIL